MNKIKIK